MKTRNVRVLAMAISLLLAGVILFGVAHSGYASTVVDQHQLFGTEQRQVCCNILDVNLQEGQTFTVGRSGILAGLELSLFIVGNPTSLNVSILDMAGGDPRVAPVLGTVSLPPSAVGPSPAGLFLNSVTATFIDLSPLGIVVNAGDALAFRLQVSSDLPDSWGVRTFSDIYPGGSYYEADSSSFELLEGDAAFKTFIAAADIGDFRGVRRPTQIGVGPDVCGNGEESINFVGAAGPAGDTWITVYDPAPNPPPATFGGTFTLSADVQIKSFNNAKGAGLLALFNEAPGKKGLALILVNNGNTDRLQLVTVDQAGKRAVLSSVALGGAIRECEWYHVQMVVIVNGADVSVIGRVYRHLNPPEPDGLLSAQVGPALSFTGPRPAGVDATGEVGIVATATLAVVNSSVTNFIQP